MDFTELYKHTAGLVAFSPGGHFLLTGVQQRLIVRRADSFQVVRTCAVDATPAPTLRALAAGGAAPAPARAPGQDGWITHVGWSCDSEYVLAACARRGVVCVFRMREEAWCARIEAGVEGLVRAEWAPDGRSVLCFSEWGLRVTVWSLVTGLATYIQFPVHPDRGYTFRADGRYFILAERHKSKDTIGVYDAAEQYKLVRHYPSPTSSLASISISPTGSNLAVWEGPLEYKLYILSLAGTLQGSFAPETDPGFGIRCVAWHPRGLFLAVGGYDDKIYILDNLTWGCVTTLKLRPTIPAGVTVWREPNNWLEATQGRGFLSYERLQGPHSLSIPPFPDMTRPHPKSGTVQLEWNKTGTYLLARFETCPTVVHIYSFPSFTQDTTIVSSATPPVFAPKLCSVLIHTRPVLHVRWNPIRKGSLAICCGSTAIYTWSDEWVAEGAVPRAGEDGAEDAGEAEEMAECIGVPAKEFATRDLRWAPDGKGLVLLDKETFCCAFEVDAEADTVA